MNPTIRNPRLMKIVFAALFIAVGALLSTSVLVAWMDWYSDEGDPRNIYYVLWKHDLNNNMNLDNALVAMSHDVSPERRVRGLTKEQLTARFGYLKALGQVTPYYRACYFSPGVFTSVDADRVESAVKSENAFFLRDSPWMVVMENGKAASLSLCKGY